MKTRDVIIGFVFLVILIAGILWIFSTRGSRTSNLPLPTPNISERIKNAFPNLDIPDGVERANLSDVTGGDSLGVATRTEVVANLPELSAGKYYQVMLEDSSGKTVKLGNMRISKSGYILEYDSTDFPGYNKVIVVLENTRILEGSF
jgi:hypothetical protein